MANEKISNSALAEIEKLKEEVALWKDRCAAERQAHEESVRHYENMYQQDY